MAHRIIKWLWIIAAVAVVALGATIFTSWYSNGWESVSPLYLKMDGAVLKNGVTLEARKKVTLKVKSAGFTDRSKNYSVQITPNAGADFAYIVEGKEHKFSEIESFNSVFDIETREGYFTVDLTGFGGGAADMQSVLERYYGGAAVTIADELSSEINYFTLTVSSGNGLYKATIEFTIKNKYRIVLDPDRVII